jgi:polyisoprenoid-binding protein YceI
MLHQLSSEKENFHSMRKILGLLLAIVAIGGSALAADEYKIDPNHSSVNFAVTHMMVSTVNGRFNAFEGKILLDEKDITKSSVNVTIKTTSINTDNSARDNDLRSAGFFDVEKFPEITFQSKSVEKKGNDYVAHGTLTIHGVSKDVDLPFELKGPVEAGKGKVMGAHGSLTINRQDYGVAKAPGMVGNDVKIDLNVEARLAPPAPAAGK